MQTFGDGEDEIEPLPVRQPARKLLPAPDALDVPAKLAESAVERIDGGEEVELRRLFFREPEGEIVVAQVIHEAELHCAAS